VLWRRLAVGSTALAACIALVVAWFANIHAGPPPMLVAELHRAGATADESSGPRSPVFVVTIDLKARMATVRPIAARSRPGRSYQLWAVRHAAEEPESLGVISQVESITMPLPSGFPSAEFVDATLSVSLEPEGGSSGRPTGPIMFMGKLAPAHK
jgi:anti-sigma-K factor RskA